MALKIGALFAGYGGLDLATEMVLPAQLAWVSEIETAPTKILAHHYPNTPNLGDITKIDWTRVEPVDIITGGSPCQDLSHAGRRAGMKAGTRSGLWASMCDAIETIKPRLVIWENVQGALSAEATIGDLESCEFCVDSTGGGNMRALGRVLGDLAEIGYHAAWTSLRAADIGAPHGRLRIFVLAWPATDTRATDGTKGGPNQRGSKGDLMLPSAVQSLFQERIDLVENITAGGVLPSVDLDQSGKVADSFWAEFDSHTPNISEENGSLPTGAWSQNGNDLLFPTPTTQDAKNSGSVSQRNRNTPPLNTVVTLLPTPAVNDMGADKTIEWWDEWAARQKSADGKPAPHGKSLHIEAQRLLPTPSTIDGKPVDVKNQMETRNSPGLQAIAGLLGMPEELWESTDMTGNWGRQEGEAQRRREQVSAEPKVMAGRLTPTPTSSDSNGIGKHGTGALDLRTTVALLPTPTSERPDGRKSDAFREGRTNFFDVIEQDRWGEYAPAIARWETVFGRPAPDPTLPTGRGGKHQLSAAFVEWMMGLPDGWVTDPNIGISRNNQLKALGNGVVPQQAAWAIRHLLTIREQALKEQL